MKTETWEWITVQWKVQPVPLWEVETWKWESDESHTGIYLDSFFILHSFCFWFLILFSLLLYLLQANHLALSPLISLPPKSGLMANNSFVFLPPKPSCRLIISFHSVFEIFSISCFLPLLHFLSSNQSFGLNFSNFFAS